MKLNNKGFAISTVMYLILLLAIILITSTLFILSSRKLIVDKQKNDVLNDIYDVICRPVTNNTASKKSDGTLIGSIPQGNFSIGDEYVCKVNDNTEYHFFVLSSRGSNINLILDRQIDSNGVLSTSSLNSLTPYLKSTDGADSTYGPITAFNFLNTATQNWTNIPTILIQYNYSDTNVNSIVNSANSISIIRQNVSLITYANLKARLPFEDELVNAGCSNTANSCPLWLSNYLMKSSDLGGSSLSGFSAYWLIPGQSTDSKLIDYQGQISDSSSYGGISSTTVVGVRPVITLLKSNFAK